MCIRDSHRIGDIRSNSQAHRVYGTNGKSVCLSPQGGGQGAKTGLYLTKPQYLGTTGKRNQSNRVYGVNGKSVCLAAVGSANASAGLYLTAPLNKSHRIAEIGNRNRSGKVSQGKGIYSVNAKSLAIDHNAHKIGLTGDDIMKLNITLPGWTKPELAEAVEKGILVVRKLTPVECERLQGFPDGYTEGVSNTRRYICLLYTSPSPRDRTRSRMPSSA